MYIRLRVSCTYKREGEEWIHNCNESYVGLQHHPGGTKFGVYVI